LEAENELRQFLKIARPDWSKPRRSGRNDVARVLAKLKAIGITDIESLIRRVETNTINEELFNKHFIPLSREALDAMRKQRAFFQGLESVDVPNVRQVGAFDPVAQMLSRRRLARAVTSAGGSPSRDRRSEDRSDGFGSLHRNSTAPGGLQRADLERFSSSTPPLSGWDSAASIASMATGSQAGLVRLRGAKPPSGRGRHRRLPVMAQPIQSLASAQGADVDRASYDEGSPRSAFSISPRPRGQSSSKFSVTWSAGSMAERSVEMEGSDAGCERPVTEKGTGRIARSKSFTAGSFTGGSQPTSPDFSQSRLLGQSRQLGSSMASVRADTPTSEELLSLQRENLRILKDMEDPSRIAAKWSQRSIKTPLEQGEDMLKEAQALDDRERLVRQVKTKSGPADPFRSHIAQNIKMRLRDEAKQSSTEGLAINQQCMNIRKQLASMVNARKELTGLRVKVEKVWEEPQLTFPPLS